MYADVPVTLRARGWGRVVIKNLEINYSYRTTVPDFAETLRNYLAARGPSEDDAGEITVPIKVNSATPGALRLLNLKIAIDGPPVLRSEIPDLRLPEDTTQASLIDLRDYFRDDYDPPGALGFCATALTNGSVVAVGISEGYYLSVDSRSSPLSENWTGEVLAVVVCSDSNSQTARSNEFRIVIYNTNDPPVIVSGAPPGGYTGEKYIFQFAAVDGDGDAVNYTLVKGPTGMTVNSSSGLLCWPWPIKGAYELVVEVSDGMASTTSSYILIVSNRPVWISNTTVPDATPGTAFVYTIPAVSETGGELEFELLESPGGMLLDNRSGALTWLPERPGNYSVSVRITDGSFSLLYNFTIRVVLTTSLPRFISEPPGIAAKGVLYRYRALAQDDDNDTLTYALLSGPPGMTIDPRTGVLEWLPEWTGSFKVNLRVSDGRGGEAVQEFNLSVVEYERPSVDILSPEEGQRVSGRVLVRGLVRRGTFDVKCVQLKIDSGDWVNLTPGEGGGWGLTVDTTGLEDGDHRIYSRAFDGSDYSKTVVLTIHVENRESHFPGVLWLGAAAAALALSGLALLWRRRTRAGRPGP
ncbi:MAG: putative Ig domain-containing protein [Thermoplasmata archaeon]